MQNINPKTMIIAKKLGIWMDHSIAHLMEFTNETNDIKNIQLEFTHQEKENSLNRSENLMHNKEQQQQADYYKKLGETIKDYNEVILFGPTDAKVELFNYLILDRHFENIKIEVESTDKMTENQEHAFVKDYFSK